MSAEDFLRSDVVEFVDDEPVTNESLSVEDEPDSLSGSEAKSPVNFSLSVEPGVEKQYSIDDLQKLSEYLNRESSSRYRAIVLNVTAGPLDSSHFEVGLVNVRNGDHRNGVVHALRVSPFNVKFV